ncbi:sensor histidine kinase [Planobispora longispora]|uniref:histidine kinase n=1 Tax=Planobispora longispora TaxID=28887 RepID=A0A8J3RQF5_9ACTN|nr:sensor histidine kinase [Planobispora longispora]GIH79223.1 histidine kinase [Planobispora longispora]
MNHAAAAPRAGRTVLEALTRRPLGFLRSSWPWRSLAYLLSGALFGIVALTLVEVAILFGIPVALALGLLTVACGGLVAGRFERWRLRLIDSVPVPDARGTPPGPGARAWLRTRLGEEATWRESGYTLLALLVLGWIDLAVLGLSCLFPLMLLSGPFQPDASLGLGLGTAVAGAALLPIAAYPMAAWAGTRAMLTRAILAPRDAELVEVVRSRARLVDAFELERRRIERDLHDGAQQRLVALTLTLGMAGLDLEPGSPAAGRVAEAQEQALLALAELRELIRGVHPKVLTDLGLPDAASDVAGRSPVPAEVDIALPGRLPAPVEAAAYFVITEALANVARHSRASRCRLRGRMVGETFLMEIHDDGIGGADPGRGTGLAGLADRVAVVDGRISVSSPAGGPTVLRVEIPCGWLPAGAVAAEG